MDLNKIFIKNACPTKIGGQAILEGIMMRGADRCAVAMRRPDGGIHLKVEPLPPSGSWKKIPILRGIVAFVSSLVSGTKILLYSAEVLESFEEEGGEQLEEDKVTMWLEKHFGEKAALNIMLYTSVVLAILFTVGIFIILPTVLVNFCRRFIESSLLINLVEGLLRIVMFVAYIAGISQMKDIKTVFQYHGAEHKTIHCYENGLELTPENAKNFTTLHPRCGTSFLMFVIIISWLAHSLLGWPSIALRVTLRLLLVPVVAGLSYEILQWAGRSTSPVVKILSVPGLLLQKLSTKEPDLKQLEVAITAMNAVLEPGEPRFYIGGIDKNGVFTEDFEREAAELEKQKAK